MRITITQIMDCLDSHIKDTITDAEWFICLVKNFMALLDEDEFNSDDLINLNYIRAVLEENKKNEHARRVLMCNEHEKYISGLFSAILAFIESNEKKCDEKTKPCKKNKMKTAKEVIENVLKEEFAYITDVKITSVADKIVEELGIKNVYVIKQSLEQLNHNTKDENYITVKE